MAVALARRRAYITLTVESPGSLIANSTTTKSASCVRVGGGMVEDEAGEMHHQGTTSPAHLGKSLQHSPPVAQ